MFDSDYVIGGACVAGLTAACERKKQGAGRVHMGEMNLFESLLSESFNP